MEHRHFRRNEHPLRSLASQVILRGDQADDPTNAQPVSASPLVSSPWRLRCGRLPVANDRRTADNRTCITMVEDPSIRVLETAGGSKAIHLAGDISVFQATELHHLARSLAEGTGDIRLECEDLQSIDLAAGQILLALHLTLSMQGRRLAINRPSEQASQLLSLVGLGEARDSQRSDGALYKTPSNSVLQPGIQPA
jgi:anti-anti-sigma regulatory factor